MIEKNFLELIASMSKESKVLVNSNKVRQSFKNLYQTSTQQQR